MKDHLTRLMLGLMMLVLIALLIWVFPQEKAPRSAEQVKANPTFKDIREGSAR